MSHDAAGVQGDLVERDDVGDGVTVLTWNRPHRRNAWTIPLQARYFDSLDECAVDPAVRVVVVTGAGGSFCPGADAEALREYSRTGTTNPDAEDIEQHELHAWHFPKPLIAAISGPCAGIGLVQALQADIRVAAQDATFTTAFAKIGLPALHGSAWLLREVLGVAGATELLLTARRLTGRDAHGIGLVHHLAEGGEVLALAVRIAQEIGRTGSPAALAVMKEQLRALQHESLEAAYERSDRAMREALRSEEFQHGVRRLSGP